MNLRECSKCCGSGKYHHGGAVVNGVYTGKIGPCFACGGKGKQTDADRARCTAYWRHNIARLGV